MGDESKPKTEDEELKEYDLDNYDEDDVMPGTLPVNAPNVVPY